MRDSDRFKLRFGSYKTHKFKYGQVLFCEVRGEVEIFGLTDAKIPWPIGKRGYTKAFVVFAGLADAVRKESNQAVCHWWGITPQTVTKWRNALGVPKLTPGTSTLQRDIFTPKRQRVMRVARDARGYTPEHAEKIRQAKLGKPRPKRVIAALRKAHFGRKWTDEQRQLIRKTRMQKKPRSYAPWAAEEDELVRSKMILEVVELTRRPHGVVERRRIELRVKGRNGYRLTWSKTEDDLLHRLTVSELAEKTGRTTTAIYHRRRELGIGQSRTKRKPSK